MVPDRIEREVLIDAPLEEVWAIVTESDHVGNWFSDSAQIELRPGGQAILTWNAHGTFLGRVDAVDPPHSVSFRWARPTETEPAERNSTLVEFVLSAEGAGTRLRVVETGFRTLHAPDKEKARYAEGNSQGWEAELGKLREYAAEQGRVTAR